MTALYRKGTTAICTQYYELRGWCNGERASETEGTTLRLRTVVDLVVCNRSRRTLRFSQLCWRRLRSTAQLTIIYPEERKQAPPIMYIMSYPQQTDISYTSRIYFPSFPFSKLNLCSTKWCFNISMQWSHKSPEIWSSNSVESWRK